MQPIFPLKKEIIRLICENLGFRFQRNRTYAQIINLGGHCPPYLITQILSSKITKNLL